MFAEDLTPFFNATEHATAATLDGVAVSVIFDNGYGEQALAMGMAGSAPRATLASAAKPDGHRRHRAAPAQLRASMASATDQIISAIQATLVAANTAAGVRVYADRVDALQPREVPAIVIEDRGETADPIDLDNTQARTTTLAIHCAISHSTTAAADARAFGLAVEKAIANSAAVKALAHMGLAITSAQTDINGEGDRLLASRAQVWQASYLVNAGAPDLINPT